MKGFELLADDWKTFEQERPQSEVPVWLKLRSGNIVLAIYRNNGSGGTGWWKVGYGKDGLLASTNSAYIARGAMWQECNQFD